jgi:hypothetical protein
MFTPTYIAVQGKESRTSIKEEEIEKSKSYRDIFAYQPDKFGERSESSVNS